MTTAHPPSPIATRRDLDAPPGAPIRKTEHSHSNSLRRLMIAELADDKPLEGIVGARRTLFKYSKETIPKYGTSAIADALDKFMSAHGNKHTTV